MMDRMDGEYEKMDPNVSLVNQNNLDFQKTGDPSSDPPFPANLGRDYKFISLHTHPKQFNNFLLPTKCA